MTSPEAEFGAATSEVSSFAVGFGGEEVGVPEVDIGETFAITGVRLAGEFAKGPLGVDRADDFRSGDSGPLFSGELCCAMTSAWNLRSCIIFERGELNCLLQTEHTYALVALVVAGVRVVTSSASGAGASLTSSSTTTGESRDPRRGGMMRVGVPLKRPPRLRGRPGPPRRCGAGCQGGLFERSRVGAPRPRLPARFERRLRATPRTARCLCCTTSGEGSRGGVDARRGVRLRVILRAGTRAGVGASTSVASLSMSAMTSSSLDSTSMTLAGRTRPLLRRLTFTSVFFCF